MTRLCRIFRGRSVVTETVNAVPDGWFSADDCGYAHGGFVRPAARSWSDWHARPERGGWTLALVPLATGVPAREIWFRTLELAVRQAAFVEK